MPSLINKIVLDMKANKLYVDDQEFPWYVQDGVKPVVLAHGFNGLTVTLIAEELEVIE